MKILIVSATEKEIFPFMNQYKSENVDFLITGVGLVFTTYQLTRKLLQNEYDLVIDAGIAGSFNRELKIGEVVNVVQDEFADLGIEDNDSFYTIFEKGFAEKDKFPFTNSILRNPNKFDLKLKEVSGISVNVTHGKKESVELFKSKFNADVETMEGAAFFYVCMNEGVKFMQIRSISNYVEERDKSSWDIPLAIDNLNSSLKEIIQNL